ncbi:ATP-binding cassette domain-containing protein [Cohnella yongneupensis]|uniref:ATP-binding cassette domain-containing protein n=1 Tax=Cohnella yongneupensis TaxID=425006 RepID=A0ABW0R5M9_9BACL
MLERASEHIQLGYEPISLRIDGIPWRCGAADAALADAGLTLAPGQLTLLIGGNGVGKTTLLEKVAGLRPPEGIQSRYGDEPVWIPGRLRKSKLNRHALLHYSYAPQSPENGLFMRTVSEELQFSARPYGMDAGRLKARVTTALSAVGWQDDAWLARDPYGMSGGERRRAALAAAFVPPVPWLLLDEPTAGLDGDGHARLGNYLMGLKDQGVGILLISHDLDWALPLADSVLLLDAEGTIRQCSREQLLASPEWLVEAGMSVPAWLDIAHHLHLRGIPAAQLWSPFAAADAMCELGIVSVETTADIDNSPHQTVPVIASLIARRREERSSNNKHRLGSFDPRTIWLSYVFISIGIFAQWSWSGLAISAVVTMLLLASGRISLWRWRALLFNYGVFSVIASAFYAAGWDSGGLTFGIDRFTVTLLPFTRTYLVMLLGLSLPLVMTPLALRNALQKLLTYKGKTPAIAHRLILTVTLMIRFIPVLIAEWGRFSRIDLSRGKMRPGRRLRIVGKMRELTLPFILSIFRLGDEIAIALESRGVTMDKRPTRTAKLRWAARDYGLVVGALLLAGGLWTYASV